jgi:hypothetical protein
MGEIFEDIKNRFEEAAESNDLHDDGKQEFYIFEKVTDGMYLVSEIDK